MTAVLFDLTGVLLCAPSGQALESALGTDAFWPDYEELRPQLNSGAIEERHFWDIIAARNRLRVDPAEAIAADWASHLDVDGPALALAQRLQSSGHPCGIVADLPTGLSTIVRREFPWLTSFAAVVLSCDTGLPAADPRSFAVALEVMGVTARDCLYVSASAAGLAGAEEAGLTPVRYVGPDSLEDYL